MKKANNVDLFRSTICLCLTKVFFNYRMTYLGRAKPNFTNDGLNDLDQLPFEILKKEDRKLYTWYLVDVNSTSVIKHIKS